MSSAAKNVHKNMKANVRKQNSAVLATFRTFMSNLYNTIDIYKCTTSMRIKNISSLWVVSFTGATASTQRRCCARASQGHSAGQSSAAGRDSAAGTGAAEVTEQELEKPEGPSGGAPEKRGASGGIQVDSRGRARPGIYSR